jgi:hypothetical protein
MKRPPNIDRYFNVCHYLMGGHTIYVWTKDREYEYPLVECFTAQEAKETVRVLNAVLRDVVERTKESACEPA